MSMKNVAGNIVKGVVQHVAINEIVNRLPAIGDGIRKCGRFVKNGGKAVLDRAEHNKAVEKFQTLVENSQTETADQDAPSKEPTEDQEGDPTGPKE